MHTKNKIFRMFDYMDERGTVGLRVMYETVNGNWVFCVIISYLSKQRSRIEVDDNGGNLIPLPFRYDIKTM